MNARLILYVSCAVFFFRLYACTHLNPVYAGMDYFGYIELAKNIFHHLDFTVRWEVDQPLIYPPLFSVLMYLATGLTKNWITSIQLINIFSASFLLIPLFSLVRNMLNPASAWLAVAFTAFYYGLKPCTILNMDFFYCFLVMLIGWLIWDTLKHRSGQAGRYVLAGFLVSLAYLTKFSGLLFGLTAAASILVYFARDQRDPGRGLRMSAWLALGVAPLFLIYHVLLGHSEKPNPSIAAYAFYDGSYMFEGGLDYREVRMSEINPQGTEYSHVERIKANNEFDVLYKDPLYVAKKFFWGFKVISQDVTFSLLPGGTIPDSKLARLGPRGRETFEYLKGNDWDGVIREVSPTEVQINRDAFLTPQAVRQAAAEDFDKAWRILSRSQNSRLGTNVLFQGAFLVLLIMTGVFLKWPLDLVHNVFFAFGMILIPFYLILERYLMPFMPFYFVLWLFILNAGYQTIEGHIKDKRFLRITTIIIFGSLVLLYFTKMNKQIGRARLYFREEVKRDDAWLDAAAWIKKDSAGLGRRPKIMSSDNFISYLTDSGYTRLPFVIPSWNNLRNFALRKGVDYIVIEGDHSPSFYTFTEDEFNPGEARARIAALNELLDNRELYKRMPVWPKGALPYIHHLQEGGIMLPVAVKHLNRFLLEANLPQVAPRKLLEAREIDGENVTFWIFKL